MPLDPNKWEPIDIPPIRPGVPLYIPPPPTSDKNPYLRTTIPSDQQLQPDMVKQQYTSAIPQIRVMPLPPSAKPGVNAAAQGIAKTIAAQAVAAIPPAVPGVTSVGLTMPPIFVNPISGSPITSAGTLAVALTGEPPNTVFAGPVNLVGNLALDTAAAQTNQFPVSSVGGPTSVFTITGSATKAGDFALLAIPATLTTVASQPDASWTQLQAIPNGGAAGGGLFWKKVPSAGNVSASATFNNLSGSPGITWGALANLITVFTSGGTPSVRQTQVQAITGVTVGGTTTIALPSNTLAGSTIFVIAMGRIGGAGNNPFTWGIADSQSNLYTALDTANTRDVNFGAIQLLQVNVFAAPSSAAAALTVTATNTSGFGLEGNTNFYVLEVTSLAAPVSIPIFRLLGAADIPNIDASKVTTGQLALARGGTGVDLSSSGGTNQFLAMSGARVISSVQPDFPNLSGVGKISKYGNINTVSNGVPSEYATVDATAQSAAITATTLYAVPASGVGMYRISWVAAATTAATTSSTLGGTNGFQIVYTDADDSVVKTTPAPGAPSAGLNQAYSQTNQGNTTASQISGVIIVNAKASTNIQYQMGYTSSGATSMQYNLHIKLEAL